MPHSLHDIINALEDFAPLTLAEAWDKVGLQVVGDGRTITRALLAIDVTEAVLAEAIAARADLIIGYHPLLFAPLVRLDGATWQCRVALAAVRAGIAIYSPHTALDATHGGVNDWLLRQLGSTAGDAGDAGGLRAVRPIVPTPLVTEGADSIRGSGRIAQFENAVTSEEIARRLELNLRGGRIERTRVHAGTPARRHMTCAVCAGSGASLLEAAAALGASAFVTGEMSHHDVLRAHALGLEVFLAGHTNTERGYLPQLAATLAERSPHTEFIVSVADRDPLQR